jgi:hypothetical protein
MSGRADEAKMGGGPDPRESQRRGDLERFSPEPHVDAIKVKTRDFRQIRAGILKCLRLIQTSCNGMVRESTCLFKGSICIHKSNQHRYDQFRWIRNGLTCLTSKYVSVGNKIMMD